MKHPSNKKLALKQEVVRRLAVISERGLQVVRAGVADDAGSNACTHDCTTFMAAQ